MGKFNGCAFGLVFLLILIVEIAITSSSNALTSYKVDDGETNRDDDGQFTSYVFVPFHLSREKRQTQVPTEQQQPDKSVLVKGNLGTKKPYLLKTKDSSNPKEVGNDKKDASSNATLSTNETPNNNVSEITTTAQPIMKVFPAKPSEAVNSSTAPNVWLNKTSDLDDDEDGPVEFPVDVQALQNTTVSNHTYYTSKSYRDGQFLWLELDDQPRTEIHPLLSDAHRRAATVKLKFDFPFYGHVIHNVTLATGGFLYLGQYVHAWLAATQYVAPLMANFDSRFENASVRFLSNETQFTVEWKKVQLHDAPQDGAFTFQTTLHNNGTIIFAYKDIPIDIHAVNDSNHPVKVGLSDAYISERNILFVKQKTIYEYHRVDLSNMTISSGSAVVFDALPTCQSFKNCDDCTSHETDFDCSWCPAAKRCSDGTDRARQDWLINKCQIQSFKSPVECRISVNTTSSQSDVYHTDDHDDHDHHDSDRLAYPEERSNDNFSPRNSPSLIAPAPRQSAGIGASGVIGILFFITVILGISGWIFYAYNYPHTPSGQLLIRFRPSQWGAFRRGEARYTAASIHM